VLRGLAGRLRGRPHRRHGHIAEDRVVALANLGETHRLIDVALVVLVLERLEHVGLVQHVAVHVVHQESDL